MAMSAPQDCQQEGEHHLATLNHGFLVDRGVFLSLASFILPLPLPHLLHLANSLGLVRVRQPAPSKPVSPKTATTMQNVTTK